MRINLKDFKFRLLYWGVNKLDKNNDLYFMNYGFNDPDKKVTLDFADEKNRYSIQLYTQLTDQIELNGKDIIEIGSGRGGGLAYIAKKHSPNSLKGIDISKSAIAFSSKHHKFTNLSFQYGDACHIPVVNNSYDVALNVESSHRYLEIDCFLCEVIRILKKGGYFLFTDFRYPYEWTELNKSFERSGLKILFKKDISPFVLKALYLDDLSRRTLVTTRAPKYLQAAMLNFAGCIGSETYNYFLSHKYVYMTYVLQKP
jgi:ubiquinone/menaquinone biosynthesis C-methylase UbiE